MGLILFLVSIILVGILAVASFIFTPIYYIVTFKWKSGSKQLERWFFKMALSLDQYGNVVCSKLLKVTLTKGDKAYAFGGEDDTVSYVLGRNKHRNTLTKLGKGVAWILDNIEKDHTDLAIKHKIKDDLEAYKRFKENRYYK